MSGKGSHGMVKGIIVILVLVCLVGGYYYYLSNKKQDKVQEENVKATVVQEVLMRNLDSNYPPSPREVIKYFGELSQCLLGETYTEEEFEQSLDFIQRCGFSAMHIFPYSKRPGTPAASMPGQAPKAVKEERARRAAEIASRMERNYLKQWEEVEVLFEEERDGLWWGHTTRYSKVGVWSGENLHNQLRQVRITAVGEGFLEGELISLAPQ